MSVPPRAKEPIPGAEPPAGQVEGFDQRLGKLEALVKKLEEGGLSLEESIEHYRQGVVLLQSCRSLLEVYRGQVEELGRSAEDGSKPYAGDPDVAS